MIKCLQLGAGHNPYKRKRLMESMPPDGPIDWTTVDDNSETHPDVLFDLNNIEHGYRLPLATNMFDELHMYSVIGLYGQQGYAEGFFRGMRELWRILKPGGIFVGGSPTALDLWGWGEPSAKRIVNDKTLSYLTREMYNGMGYNAQSDYRSKVEPCWWKILFSQYSLVGDCQTYHWVLGKVG